MEWINIKDRLPGRLEIIIYTRDCGLVSAVGRYCDESDPMPSAPNWLPWSDVKYWMPLPPLTEKDPKERIIEILSSHYTAIGIKAYDEIVELLTRLK